MRARVAFVLLSSEMHCVACYRFGRLVRGWSGPWAVAALPLRFAHRLWNRWCTHLHHCDIHRDARIGPGLIIMHRTGVIIGPVTIGPNATIYQNVTLGMRIAGNDHGTPVLGRNVWLGPGATVTGAVEIGDGVTVAAGTVLSRDVPAGSLVAGNPGRVISRDYDNRGIVGVPVS